MTEEKQIEEMAKELCQNGFCSTERHDHCRLPEGSYCWDTEIIAEKFYNAGYRKQREGEWISVDERLPRPHEAVLVYNGKIQQVVYNLYKKEDRWWTDEGGYTTEGFGVTHWMPFPEPPKMKGGE